MKPKPKVRFTRVHFDILDERNAFSLPLTCRLFGHKWLRADDVAYACERCPAGAYGAGYNSCNRPGRWERPDIRQREREMRWTCSG